MRTRRELELDRLVGLAHEILRPNWPARIGSWETIADELRASGRGAEILAMAASASEESEIRLNDWCALAPSVQDLRYYLHQAGVDVGVHGSEFRRFRLRHRGEWIAVEQAARLARIQPEALAPYAGDLWKFHRDPLISAGNFIQPRHEMEAAEHLERGEAIPDYMFCGQARWTPAEHAASAAYMVAYAAKHRDDFLYGIRAHPST